MNTFQQYLKDKSCQFININLVKSIVCNCSKISDYFEIEYIFHKELSIKINKSHSFKRVDETCYFLIHNNLRNNNWIFGITVFKTYLTEFNYQDNSITFYNTKSLKPSINIQILLLQILLTIQIINMLYLFMFYKVRLN